MTDAKLKAEVEAAISTMMENVINPESAAPSEIFEKCTPLLSWLSYIHTSELTGCGDEFIDGFRASIVETVFCVSSGLARLALFSMRSQIDICCSWLYFKDHPFEYAKVHKTSDGFMLKSAVFSYLEDYYPHFKSRFSKLENSSCRVEKDPYRLLSAHVHSQSQKTLPTATSFSSIVATPQTSVELITVQAGVTEFISDILFACFGPKWAGLPDDLVIPLKDRLSQADLSVVFR